MIKIMFVCHGNICRSPMAEFIFKQLLLNENLSHEFLVESSATSSEEIYNGIGNLVYPPALKELLKHGIDPKNKRAVKLTAKDAEIYDYFIGMDNYNINNMYRILGSKAQNKIHKLLSFCGSNDDVYDPWYSRDFTTCYNEIYRGCKALLEHIKKVHT